MNILYISNIGILEPLGQSQILAYLYKLSQNYNYKITIILWIMNLFLKYFEYYKLSFIGINTKKMLIIDNKLRITF